MKKLNSSEIDIFMREANIPNNRSDELDFDGSHFCGEFDKILSQLNYIRVGVERNKDIELMILIPKDKLDLEIKNIYSYDTLYQCEKSYFQDDFSDEPLFEAYYSFYNEICKKFIDNMKDFSMYIDGLDYILNMCDSLGYKFGKEKFN